jgi:hypothetical protein
MGENIPFQEYIENTVGISPTYIPEADIEKQHEIVKGLYKEMGYEYTKKGLEIFRKEHTLTQQEVEQSFLEAKNTFVPKVLSWLSLNVSVEYKTEFVSVDDYWMNWTSTDEKGNLVLQFNIHPNSGWTTGFPEHLALHEICGHVIQTSVWKQQIAAGTLSPVAGVTTCITPEMFIAEGIGDTLSWFYPEQLYSLAARRASQEVHLYWLLWNNAHIMVNEDKPIPEILEYLDRYLPSLESQEVRRGNLLKAKNNPFHRSYLYVYGISSYYHIKLAEKLSEEGKREYVTSIYNTILTPKDILLL